MSDFDKNFERAVDDAFKNESADILSNGSLKHAKYLIAKLLEKGIETRTDVKISSGSLNKYVFCSEAVLNASRDVLNAGAKIEVIVENEIDDAENNDFYNLINNSNNGTVHKKKDAAGYPEGVWHHYTLIGSKAFRIEISHKTAEAFGCFNHPAFASRLKGLFKKQQSFCETA